MESYFEENQIRDKFTQKIKSIEKSQKGTYRAKRYRTIKFYVISTT